MAEQTIVKQEENIEISEPEAAPAPEVITREDVKGKGWSADEIKKAEERGMIKSPEEAKKISDEAAAKAKGEAEAKEKAESEAKGGADAAAVEKAKKDAEVLSRREEDRGGIPDFTMTPDQEKVFLETFPKGTTPRAMYFRMKNERSAKQYEKRGRELAEARAAAAEERIKELEKPKPRQLVDEDGNAVDPDDLPLTPKRLKELREKEAEETRKANEERDNQARTLVSAQTQQEEYCKEIYPDFDETVDLANKLIKNLDKLVPDPMKRSKIRNLVGQLKFATLNADKIDLDEYHAAQIAYDLGQFHPEYGKKAEADPPNGDASDTTGNPTDPKKANGSLTPDQMKRIEENAHRRASSASVSGGAGKRSISVDEVDVATLNKMVYSERQRFKEKHPDRYAKLLRG